jgi:hypothetical protein
LPLRDGRRCVFHQVDVALNADAASDHARRARKRSQPSSLDASDSAISGYRDVLPGRIRSRLYVAVFHNSLVTLSCDLIDQWTAHALGIRHFAIQHDLSFTSPNLPIVAYPEGFQGTAVTVVGNLVADIIEDRLAGKI